MKGTVPKRLDICYYFGTFYTILNFYFLIIDFNAPVNKIPEGTAERHLRHHVNLNNNYDNKYEPKKSSAVTRAHTVSLFLSVRDHSSRSSSFCSAVFFSENRFTDVISVQIEFDCMHAMFT